MRAFTKYQKRTKNKSVKNSILGLGYFRANYKWETANNNNNRPSQPAEREIERGRKKTERESDRDREGERESKRQTQRKRREISRARWRRDAKKQLQRLYVLLGSIGYIEIDCNNSTYPMRMIIENTLAAVHSNNIESHSYFIINNRRCRRGR